jgi:hypothetical protein
MYFTLWFLYFTLWYTEDSYSQTLIYLYESYNYFPHSPLQTYTRLKNECYLLIHVIKHVFHLQVSLKYLPLQCVFHSIRFKVNKGWSSAELLFLCPYSNPYLRTGIKKAPKHFTLRLSDSLSVINILHSASISDSYPKCSVQTGNNGF